VQAEDSIGTIDVVAKIALDLAQSFRQSRQMSNRRCGKNVKMMLIACRVDFS